jgi:hypothetical protein
VEGEGKRVLCLTRLSLRVSLGRGSSVLSVPTMEVEIPRFGTMSTAYMTDKTFTPKTCFMLVLHLTYLSLRYIAQTNTASTIRRILLDGMQWIPYHYFLIAML